MGRDSRPERFDRIMRQLRSKRTKRKDLISAFADLLVGYGARVLPSSAVAARSQARRSSDRRVDRSVDRLERGATFGSRLPSLPALAMLSFAIVLVAATVAACVRTGAAEDPRRGPMATATTSAADEKNEQAQRQSPASPATAATTPTSTPIEPGYLRAQGSKLVDAKGKEVILTGINWFGMETGTYAPHGLWSRNWNDMLDQIDSLGYNTIRLPFSNQILDPNSRPLEGIDFEKNPDLRGLNGLQIMDKIVEGAGKRGIKIILDRHRPSPEGQSKLWYTDEVPEETWIADWQFLARRYRDNDTVIGADIHNEPAGDATWGTGDPKTDWRLAAERAGNAILEVNPNWLIIVEGVEKQPDDWYWMGGNLAGVAKAPVRLSRPDKLVYSAHDYGPGVFQQRWFQEKEFPANMPAIWDAHWGYIVKENIAPVLLGEFGGRSVGSDTEGVWQRELMKYLKQNGISYTYWCFNPNSGDTGGVLEDDWQTVNQAKQDLLAAYQTGKIPIANPSFVDASGVPVARKKPLPAQPVKVQFRTPNVDTRAAELALEIQILNETESRLPLENVVLSYWLSAPDLTPSEQAISIDWSSVDQRQIKIEMTPDERAGQTHRITISFSKFSGMVPAHGKAELKLRVKRGDRGAYDQASAFSFRPNNAYADAEQIPLDFWGSRIWGREP